LGRSCGGGSGLCCGAFGWSWCVAVCEFGVGGVLLYTGVLAVRVRGRLGLCS